MALRPARPFPEPPPAQAPELVSRLTLALVAIALAFAVIASQDVSPQDRGRLEVLVLPRLAAFLLAAWVAGLIQGARPSWKFLLGGGLLSSLAALLLLPDAGAAWRTDFSKPMAAWDARHLGLLQASILAAAFWGTLFARGLAKPGHLLAVVLCASAGDAWMNMLQIPENLGEGHPLKLLRLEWPPLMGRVAAAPSLPDLLFFSLYLEAARRFRFHMPTILFGALAGYAVASLLSLATLRVTLALPLVGLGVMLGAWPEFRCTAREVTLAFASAVLLFLALMGFHQLHEYFYPEPVPRKQPVPAGQMAKADYGVRQAFSSLRS